MQPVEDRYSHAYAIERITTTTNAAARRSDPAPIPDGPAPTAQQFSDANVMRVGPDPGGSNVPYLYIGNASVGYTYAVAPSTAVSTFKMSAYDGNVAASALNAMTLALNNINISAASSDDQACVTTLISNARASIATANGTAQNLISASDATNTAIGSLQIIGSTSTNGNGFGGFYVVIGNGDTVLGSYPFKIDIAAAMDNADAKSAMAARRARERAIAAAALKLYGMNTKNLPGTSNGS